MKHLFSTFNSEPQRGREALRIFKGLLYFAPIPLLMIAVNLKIDPANIFKGSLTPEDPAEVAVKLLTSGHNVGLPYGFNDRPFQKLFIERQTEQKDLVIFGASMTLQIGTNIFPKFNLLNHSVMTYSLNDVLGLYRCYLRAGHPPKRVLLGVDPTMLNKNNAVKYPLLKAILEKDANEMKAIFTGGSPPPSPDITAGATPPNPSKTQTDSWKRFVNRALLSPSYFQESLHALNEELSPRLTPVPVDLTLPPSTPVPMRLPLPFATNETEADFRIYHQDGTLSYRKEEVEHSVEVAARKAIDYASKDVVNGYEGFDRIDPELTETLEAFLSYLAQHETEVTVLMLPYHPEAYNRLILRKDTQTLLIAETYFRGLTRLGVRVFGSFNPATLGFGREDFFDQVHLRKDALKRLPAELLFK